MKRLTALVCMLFAHASPAEQTLDAQKISHRLLIVAPHPDDVLLSAGLIFRTREQGGHVKVVDLTSGDSKSVLAFQYIERKGFKKHSQPSINYGYFRQKEDEAAHRFAGGTPDELSFLGFPDGGLWKILGQSKVKNSAPYTSPNTGVDSVPYLDAVKPGAPYLHSVLVELLATQIVDFKPDMIVTTHPNDNHSDHAATYYLTLDALKAASIDSRDLPIITPLDAFAVSLPKTLTPDQTFAPPRLEAIPSPTKWSELTLSPEEIAKKVKLISHYPSQMVWEHPTVADYKGTRSYMYGYVGTNELYGQVMKPKEDLVFRENLDRQIRLARMLAVLGNVIDDWLSGRR